MRPWASSSCTPTPGIVPDSIDGIHVTLAFARGFDSSDLVPARLLPTAGNLTSLLSTALPSVELLRITLPPNALHAGCTRRARR